MALKKSGLSGAHNLSGERPDAQKGMLDAPKPPPNMPKTTTNKDKPDQRGFIPLLNEDDLQATKLVDDFNLAVSNEKSESKTNSFLVREEANVMNEISAINNSTQPDTSLNLTHAELVAKLRPLA